jgi:hypothetical protein
LKYLKCITLAEVITDTVGESVVRLTPVGVLRLEFPSERPKSPVGGLHPAEELEGSYD